MAKTKSEPATPVKPKSGWQEFEHWVYCPDAPGKCKCDTKK